MIISAALSGIAFSGVKSGHAEAELLAATEDYAAGQPLQLGIRLKMDEGWHSYWVNPGDGGMEMSVDWTLPEGWKAGPLQYPVPIRFMTGDLPGFGYEDEVVLPVRLTPAVGASGPATIRVALSWLTCSDSACVPGSADLELVLAHGAGKATGNPAISAALDQLPEKLEGAALEVTTQEKMAILKVSLPGSLDATGCTVYPATPEVLDIGKVIKLRKSDGGWEAEVPLHEYATGAPSKLDLVLTGGNLSRPLLLQWSSEP
ncbi:protein-disulfide reductase DsbD domain-containing protein [Haloferula chungangensis]|uniref:Protein-disulfide reductase DsbD domain-containing protein n=2 Tax=Haloferula chungangensis TaxID=1048331 RepID=A0ABW2L5Z7_9BACT